MKTDGATDTILNFPVAFSVSDVENEEPKNPHLSTDTCVVYRCGRYV